MHAISYSELCFVLLLFDKNEDNLTAETANYSDFHRTYSVSS